MPGNPKQRGWIIGLILLGTLIVGFFGWRTLHAFRQFRGHRPPPPPPFATQHVETDVNMIRDWMTIPFIARTYNVPPHSLFAALQIPEHKDNREKSLQQLNEEYYPQTPGIVLKKVKATILANLPPRTPTAPATPTVP